jgi:hypothetical protein
LADAGWRSSIGLDFCPTNLPKGKTTRRKKPHGAKNRVALALRFAQYPAMRARVLSAAVNGVEAFPVELEVNSGWGDSVVVIVELLPKFPFCGVGVQVQRRPSREINEWREDWKINF